MHAVRSARPKLSLAVPTVAAAKPSVPTLIVPAASSAFSRPAASPLTPTARNTVFNSRASSSLQVPSAATARVPKKSGKRVSFAEQQIVTLVSPCPQDYYGEYVKMSRDERRWARN